MNTAHYHQPGLRPIVLEVVATHDDKTVDLARDGEIVVSHCPVSAKSQPGHCTIGQAPAPDLKAMRHNVQRLQNLASKAENDRIKAANAAHAAKGKPAGEQLARVAEEAKVAADEAIAAADAAEAEFAAAEKQ